ncbi:phosphoglycolate phosphatase [Aureococcus anophagefferens]|nr:phosphoglycolate phosphatase [Aureococcus anophagefferens]
MPSSLADGYDCVVFDCDGVLWSGGETIAGAFATLDALERAGKKVYFMSNNSSRGLAEFRRVFEAHGLGRFVRDDARVWNSLTAARHWFEERGRRGDAFPAQRGLKMPGNGAFVARGLRGRAQGA